MTTFAQAHPQPSLARQNDVVIGRSARRPDLARLAVGLAIAFLVTTVGLLASAGPALGWYPNSFSSSAERELVSLTNQARAAAGLRALKVDAALTSIARWRSKDMIVKDYFSHSIPPSGKMVFSVLDSKGYCYKIAGENIGWNNYPDDVATRTIQRQFMDSSGHRANILGKAWDVVGIGAYKGPSGKKMWTVLFADKCGTTAPKPTPKPAAPATPPPTATPEPASTPTPEPTDPIGLGFGPGGKHEGGGDNGNGGASGNGPPPGQGGDKPADAKSTSMRVVEESAPPGLFETIVGGVTGFFLGG